MSLIKDMKNIINNNKLVFVFILGLLTCYLIFNCGSCKEGYEEYCECINEEGRNNPICAGLPVTEACLDMNISTKRFDIGDE